MHPILYGFSLIYYILHNMRHYQNESIFIGYCYMRVIKLRKNHEYIQLFYFIIHDSCASWNKHATLFTQHIVFLSPCGLVNPLYIYSMCTRDNNDLLFHSLWLLYKLYYITLYSIFYLLFPCFFLTDFANRFKILEILELYLFTNIYIYIFILQIFFKDIYSNLILFLLIFFLYFN